MGPPSKTLRSISQVAFDEVVKENMEDLGMEPAEALQDAIDTLTLQGVDLSGIVTCVPGEAANNPLLQCLDSLKKLDSGDLDGEAAEMPGLFNKLANLLSEETGNPEIAVKNGGVQSVAEAWLDVLGGEISDGFRSCIQKLVCSLCSKLSTGSHQALAPGFSALALMLHDLQSTEMFRSSGGPAMVVSVSRDGSENVEILSSGFAVVAAAATGNEVLKELFMELKIDELVLQVLSGKSKSNVQSLYDAIRVLLTPDDNRVVASQVYVYARRFAKIGIATTLVESLQAGLASPGLVSASIALRAIAVNDEICKSIAEAGGIDVILRCIDDSGEQGNKTVAKTCCSLLSKLAGSDSNKCAIIEKGGMNKLIKLSARFSDDPSVLQEVMSIFTVLSLRSPDNAARAIEAGAGDFAIQAMQRFPNTPLLQKNSCFMIRNLVARNPENRTLLLNLGIESIIRKAKENHETCKDAATDALRDLGLDNYNS